MFLPNLQKNIQELEKQISRLESECEQMGRRDRTPAIAKESTNQPFVTGPSISTTTYSTKMANPADVDPANPPRQTSKQSDLQTMRFVESPKPPEKKFKTTCEDSRPESRSRAHEKRSPDGKVEQKRRDRKGRSPWRKSMQATGEGSESSDENRAPHPKAKSRLKESPKDQTWCHLLGEQAPGGKTPHKTRNKDQKSSGGAVRKKICSDEDSCERSHVPLSARPTSETGTAPRRKQRSRSARTKKNCPAELPDDAGASKSLQEKEIQCILWNEDQGRGEFFINISDSVTVLQGLIEELKKKTSQERRDDVLNDMQNALKKLTQYGELSVPQECAPVLDEDCLRLPEGVENIMNMRKALYAVKKICEELASEKAALAEEVSLKNITLSNLKAKEKEYLGLIASLRVNLEKVKEAAEEGTRSKKDLKIMTVKLQEEAKVIEALKKSHEKMQAIVENYVLENDKLKAHLRINKLETQKYNVLLAGKEAEIAKYKKEIESFQKQITEQLTLLRSRATEVEVQQTIEAIGNQANVLQKDAIAPQYNFETAASFSTTTHSSRRNKTSVEGVSKWASESKPSVSSTEIAKKGAQTSRVMSQDSELGNSPAKSDHLRSSINELLREVERESSDVFWVSTPNSARSNSNLSTSEDVSDESPKD